MAVAAWFLPIALGIFVYSVAGNSTSQIAAECVQCTSRGYHFYHVGHPHMNNSFVCFDYRHLFLVDTVIYDRALDQKECGNFYSRINATKVKAMKATGREVELLLEFGEKLTRRNGNDNTTCLPPILCFFLGVVLSVFGPQAYFYVKDRLAQSKLQQVPVV